MKAEWKHGSGNRCIIFGRRSVGVWNRTNGEWGEVVIHRISTSTPQSASNASKRWRSETDDNHSPAAVASKLFFHARSRFKGIFYRWKIVKDDTKLLLYFQSGSFRLVETNQNKQNAVHQGKWQWVFKHEGVLYKEVFPGKTKAHLSVTVDERGSNSKWRAIWILER